MDEQLSYVDLRGVGSEERAIGAGQLSNGVTKTIRINFREQSKL